jgi:hypothetical protein
MKPVLREGVIMNAAALNAEATVNQRVKCPACGVFPFQKWPEGWDAHASYKCEALDPGTPDERKAQFRTKFAKLFR